MKTRYRYNENPGGAVMSSHYVYVIVNKINLKLYFGSHTWDGEGLDKNYYGSGKIIKQAVKKYGKDNFIVYPIKFYDTIEECRQAEEELLKKYDIANNQYCYNIKNGAIGWTSEDMKGEKNPNYGKHHTEETRQKMSQASKGENNPMYGKRGKDSPMYGKQHTEETRRKISQANKGEKHPMYGKRGKGTPRYGKHHTEETRNKLALANIGENNPMFGRTGEKSHLYGRTLSEEHRNKIAIANGGKPFVAIKDGKVKIFTSQHECSRVLGLNQQSISKCLKGRRNHTGGYTFKYVEELESVIYEGML